MLGTNVTAQSSGQSVKVAKGVIGKAENVDMKTADKAAG